jgi:hypothetical protein
VNSNFSDVPELPLGDLKSTMLLVTSMTVSDSPVLAKGCFLSSTAVRVCTFHGPSGAPPLETYRFHFTYSFPRNVIVVVPVFSGNIGTAHLREYFGFNAPLVSPCCEWAGGEANVHDLLLLVWLEQVPSAILDVIFRILV